MLECRGVSSNSDTLLDVPLGLGAIPGMIDKVQV